MILGNPIWVQTSIWGHFYNPVRDVGTLISVIAMPTIRNT